MKDIVMTAQTTLANLDLTEAELTGGTLAVRSPIDGSLLAEVHETPAAEMGADLCPVEGGIQSVAHSSGPAPGRVDPPAG